MDDANEMKTVLLVMADRSLKNQLLTIVKKQGFSVSMADTGEKALSIMDRVSPSIVIVESTLSDMSGFTFCKKVRNKQAGHPCIVFISRRVGMKEKVIGKFLGIDRFYKKPTGDRAIRGLLEEIRQFVLRFTGSDKDLGGKCA